MSELEQRAQEACKAWAHAREPMRGIIEQSERLAAFDRAMFRLGEVAGPVADAHVERPHASV